MPPGAGDELFYAAWERVEAFIDEQRPSILRCKKHSNICAGDPITHLRYSPAAYRHAAQRLLILAEKHCQGRLLAMGGGGYNRGNLALAWTVVVQALLAD